MIGGGAGILIAFVLQAQSVPPHHPLSPEQLAAKAGLVGVAVVLRTQPRKDPNGAVYTDARLQFQEVWKGSVPPGFVLTQFGGTLDGVTSSASHANYALRPGERIAVFAVPMKGESWCVVGMRQGLFHISPTDPKSVVKDTEIALPESRRSETSLDGLRRRVYAATGRALPEPAPPEEAKAEPTSTETPAVPTASNPETAAVPPAAPADPARSAGLAFALLLLLATLAIGWTQWKRKTENAG